MATLRFREFDTAGGAENALTMLGRMQKEELLQRKDGAYVTRPEGKERRPSS